MRCYDNYFESKAQVMEKVRELNNGGFNVISVKHYTAPNGKTAACIYYE